MSSDIAKFATIRPKFPAKLTKTQFSRYSLKMNDNKQLQLSRFLSLVLRHRPEAIGIRLDRNGWAEVDVLIEAMNQHGRFIDHDTLKQIVAMDNKQRYTFSHDKKRIRASQGHSIDIDLNLTPTVPPEILFHGTDSGSIAQIKQQGLRPQKRNHVHLSTDLETAIRIGSRHGKPVVLMVDAKKMYEHGQLFYLSENNIWLTDSIMPEYLQVFSAVVQPVSSERLFEN